MDPNATEALLDLACHKQTGQNCRAAMKKYGDTCDDTTVVRNIPVREDVVLSYSDVCTDLFWRAPRTMLVQTIAAEASAAKQMAAQTKFQTNGSCAARELCLPSAAAKTLAADPAQQIRNFQGHAAM